MSQSAGRFPKLTRHKASGQGVVRLDGKDVDCGPFGTAECQTRYLRAVTAWSERGRLDATTAIERAGDITLNELLLGFLTHAVTHYVKGGRPTGEVSNITDRCAKNVKFSSARSQWS
jgi:hypothetical protein